MPLKPAIYKRLLNFYHKMKNVITTNPLSPILHIFKDIMNKKLLFIKRYVKLDENFECYNFYVGEQKSLFADKRRK